MLYETAQEKLVLINKAAELDQFYSNGCLPSFFLQDGVQVAGHIWQEVDGEPALVFLAPPNGEQGARMLGPAVVFQERQDLFYMM